MAIMMTRQEINDHCKALLERGTKEDVEHAVTLIRGFQEWVSDLQDGQYVNCVYCGHRYGPDAYTPVTAAQMLKDHVMQCPAHPMTALKKRFDDAATGIRRIASELNAGSQPITARDKLRALAESMAMVDVKNLS